MTVITSSAITEFERAAIALAVSNESPSQRLASVWGRAHSLTMLPNYANMPKELRDEIASIESGLTAHGSYDSTIARMQPEQVTSFIQRIVLLYGKAIGS
jgi:hypothetical protein